MSDELPDLLRPNGSDLAATIISAGVNLIPVVGGFFARLATEVIPNQRQERIAEFCAQLGRRVKRLQQIVSTMSDRIDAQEQAMAQFAQSLSAEQVELFKDGAMVAARATTSGRIERVAELVARGLNEPGEAAQNRQLAALLDQISDDEVVVLCAHQLGYAQNPEWVELHRAALEQTVWRAKMTGAERDKVALQEHKLDRLVALGLLRVDTTQTVEGLAQLATPAPGGRMRRPPDKLPVSIEKSSPKLTPLGAVLLRHMGLERPDPVRPPVEYVSA